MRSIAAMTVLLFSNAILFPYALYAKEALSDNEKIHLYGADSQKLNQALLYVQDIAAEKRAIIEARYKQENHFVANLLDLVGLEGTLKESFPKLEQLQKPLQELNNSAMQGFEDTEQWLIERQYSKDMMARHQEAVSEYETHYQTLDGYLNTLFAAKNLKEQKQAITDLDEFMALQQLEPTHESVDPNHMPWGIPDIEAVPQPLLTAASLHKRLGLPADPNRIMVASNEITDEMLSLPGGPVPADLKETMEVQLTDDIKAKAEALEHNPIKIYNWVRNNIEFIPSHGSIQGAQYTLEMGKGNATDTASLLIALLRASNIPARYAYGSVDVSLDKLKNWAGGAQDYRAAIQVLGQGGIPVGTLNMNGKITHARMEHVWVEAWIDYHPSRGVHHVEGDTWIPLDASYKEYEYTERVKLEEAVTINEAELAETLQQGVESNEAEGWIKGVDATKLEAALADYQLKIKNHIDNQEKPLELVDLMGSKTIKAFEVDRLTANLPYQLKARTKNFSEIPNNLRHKFRYNLNTLSHGMVGSQILSFEEYLPALAGKRLSVSFAPEGPEDQKLIKDQIPEPDETTGEIDASQIPERLPGHLIKMKAEFNVDGQMVFDGYAGTMGTELHEELAVWGPNLGWRFGKNKPIVGEYQAIGLMYQGINPEEVARHQARMEATQQTLSGEDETALMALTKDQLIGDLLFGNIYSYLAMVHLQEAEKAAVSDIIHYRLPSFGKFSTSLTTEYWFGMPRHVRIAGMMMDVDSIMTQAVSKDADDAKRNAYMKATGSVNSALEHLVPEKIFSTDEQKVQGISAVKALGIAMAEGQKIWTIDSNNIDLALEQIHLSKQVEREIRDAVYAGKIATAHERPVKFAGGTNAGYILLDPTTGAGAYKIAGGENGAFLIIAGLSMIILSCMSIMYMGPHFWTFLTTTAGQIMMGSIFSSALALIAAGIEMMQESLKIDSKNTCAARFIFLDGAVTGFLGIWLPALPIVSLVAAIAIGFIGIAAC